jgi:hypothetical protein
LWELTLVPVRVRSRQFAGFIETDDLIGRQIPTHRAKVLAKLFLIPRANDQARNSGPL